MESFKDFYNGLDIFNLILFWGTIIVIILIIIFLILYFSRKRKVDVEDNNDFDNIDVIKLNDSNIEDQNLSDNSIDKDSNLSIQNMSNDMLNVNLDNDIIEIPIQEKKIETKNNLEEIYLRSNGIVIEKKNNVEENNVNTVIEKNDNIQVKKDNDEFLFDELVKKDISDEKPRAYQKNFFKEMNSRNQTSPIGIIYKKEENILDEFKDSMQESKTEYLENVYNSLEKASVPDKVELTEYEKQQEEQAVISYQELIKKKDTIDYDKEEDAVISYGELLNSNSRLYNIREEEEDQEFLSELKKFRRDL